MLGRRCGLFGSSLLALGLALASSSTIRAQQTRAAATPQDATSVIKRASVFFRSKAASHGGYVYYYAPDFSWRRGEGKATEDQVWVQRPGTPAVGLTMLRAYEITKDPFYLDAAKEAALALVYGQLESGGWTNAIDFDPAGKLVAQYRGGRGKGRNYSTLDDGISQHALRFMMRMDKALGFKDKAIHECSETARTALLAAQFPSGAFPQVWLGPIKPHAPVKASFPDYDWRTENRIKEYWDLPTLNDDLAGNMAAVLEEAWAIYQDKRCRDALIRLGDFLIIAQLPEPQPGWAQQYDTRMRPVWARKFEPPAIAGRESQNAMETLLRVHRLTGDKKYLEPIPRGLAYLKKSLLPDGQLPRYLEIGTNTPLYMTRDYKLTNSDSDLPEHYGWKVEATLDTIAAELNGQRPVKSATDPRDIRTILEGLDQEGRWVSRYQGERLVGNPKFQMGEAYIASEVFCQNVETLLASMVKSSD